MTSETNRRKQKLAVKGFTIVGVFSAIILIRISLNGGPFTMSLALTFYFPVGAALLAGPVYLLPIAKVPKPGPIFITGLMMAIPCYVTGMHIGMSIDYLVGGALADLVVRAERYQNIRISILSYVVFCLDGTGSYPTYFINPQAWIDRMSKKSTPQEYLGTIAATVSHWILISILAGTVLVALFSGFVGGRLLKKQFGKVRIMA